MAMTMVQKQALRDQIAGRFQKSSASIVAEYRGMTVAELTDLRRKLRASNSEFRVIKNRVAKVAITEAYPEGETLKGSLKGPVGVIFIYGDPAAAAKSLIDFEKESEKFKISEGLMEGKRMTAGDIKSLASLPSREVLLARIVGSLVSPHRGLLGVLSGVPRQLVQVINAIKEKKS